MNDIIQNLEANATNGKENFCYISEKQLNAMKELSKREAKENKQLKDNWNKLKEYLFDMRKRGFALQNLANVTKNTEPGIAILIIINKIQELERSDK